MGHLQTGAVAIPPPHLVAVTRSADPVTRPLPLQPRLKEAMLPAERCVRGGERPQPCLTLYLLLRRTLPVQRPLLLAAVVRVVDGRRSRWLIPSTIPGASQLFKTLLTRGDNPEKAVKYHVVRGRGREQGHIQDPGGSGTLQL